MSFQPNAALQKKNKRTALIVAAFAVFVLCTSLPFWMGMMKVIGNQAG